MNALIVLLFLGCARRHLAGHIATTGQMPAVRLDAAPIPSLAR
jgi:hypothetical protein